MYALQEAQSRLAFKSKSRDKAFESLDLQHNDLSSDVQADLKTNEIVCKMADGAR